MVRVVTPAGRGARLLPGGARDARRGYASAMERSDGRMVVNDAGGTATHVPFDPRQLFGRVRAPVLATINGHPYRTTLMRYGGVDYLGVNRAVRDAIGVADGDTVTVTIEADPSPRGVAVPAELAAALTAEPQTRAAFDALSYSHRREHAAFVAEAKRPETRARRAEATVARLRQRGADA
jgi:Bacteriocin-protection, YdeI or OmpD-Associated/Domain of unknown function (DUF1905)